MTRWTELAGRAIVEDGFSYYARDATAAAESIVEESWTIRAVRCRTLVQGVLPDPTAELYFNLGPEGRRLAGPGPAGRLVHRAAWVVGPHADTLLVEKEIRDCEIVGIRLRPGVLALALGVPAVELAGAMVDLDCFWGRWADELRERLALADEPERPRLVEEAVAARIRARGGWDEQRQTRTLALAAATGDGSVATLAKAHGLSHRRVIALFDRHIGLKPKTYQRVARLRRVMEAIGSVAETGWAGVAARHGYCYQAHLIHEFRRLAGLTPREYARTRSSVGHGFVPHRTVA